MPFVATLDQVMENLRQNFSEGTEYFQLLVEVFASRFGSSKVVIMNRVAPYKDVGFKMSHRLRDTRL